MSNPTIIECDVRDNEGLEKLANVSPKFILPDPSDEYGYLHRSVYESGKFFYIFITNDISHADYDYLKIRQADKIISIRCEKNKGEILIPTNEENLPYVYCGDEKIIIRFE